MSEKKLAAVCISDFHIGENLGGVSGTMEDAKDPGKWEEINKNVFLRKEFKTLLESLKNQYKISKRKRVKFLIIMGDQWDLAVQNLPYSANLSLGFFNKIGLQDYFEQVIYIPGNHDHHLWDMFQAQHSVVEPLEKIAHGDSKEICTCKEFPQVLPGYLDLTGDSAVLKINDAEPPKKGNGFITGLTGNPGLPVQTVYPNLYVIYGSESKKEAMLLTHGHLFDPGWNIITDFFRRIGLLDKIGVEEMTLYNLELLNSPMTEFLNYGMAQMGPYDFIDLVYDQMMNDVFPPLIDESVDGIIENIVKKMNRFLSCMFDKFFKKHVEESIDEVIEKKIQESVISNPRYDQDFLKNNADRVAKYLDMSKPYLSGYPIQGFSRMMFGHTHVPLWAYKTGDLGSAYKDMEIYNTGGWVNIDEADFPLPLCIFEDGTIDRIMIEKINPS